MSDVMEINDTVEREETPQAESPENHIVDFKLCGLDGAPIEGLKCRINVGEKIYNYETDADGKIPEMTHQPGDAIEFSVVRDNGTYKTIAQTITDAGKSNYTLISPAFVVEANTEENSGAPGEAEKNIPKPVPFQVAATSTAVAENKEEGRAKVEAKPAIEPTAKVAPRPKISGNTVNKPKPATGRDTDGKPLAVVTKKTEDWWGRWRMPTLNLWSVADFFNYFKKGDNLTRNVASGSAPAPSKSQLERLNLLLQIAEEHVTWKIEDDTATVVARMVRGTFKNPETKEPTKAMGWCAKYVKIALTQAGITPNTATGLLQFDSGSGGGVALLKAGFKDITKELPDARWAAPGDVVVYRWSDRAWENRKTSPRWGGSKKKPNPNVPNHGHIDIRSHENYISDYMPSRRHPTWSDYTDIHIYRSAYYDPLPELRMKAFLRCIRDYECQAEKDDAKRYNMLNTALPDSKSPSFSDYQTHPWFIIEKAKWPKSTAAGAYQITCTTWLGLTKGLGKGGVVNEKIQDFFFEIGDKTFSPEVQDRMAVALIDSRKNDPLGDIRKGKFEDAIPKLIDEWTSLPGAKENATRRTADGKPMDMAHFRFLYERHLDELLKKKGWK